MAYVFAIDVSFTSVMTGVLADVCRSIREMLDKFPREFGPSPSPVRVGFMTYDRTVHFYNLTVRPQSNQWKVAERWKWC